MAKNLNPCSCSMDLTEHQCWESWNPSDTRSHGRKTLWRSISSPVCLMGVTIPWDSGCTSSTTVPIPCRGSRRWLWLSLMPCDVTLHHRWRCQCGRTGRCCCRTPWSPPWRPYTGPTGDWTCPPLGEPPLIPSWSATATLGGRTVKSRILGKTNMEMLS